MPCLVPAAVVGGIYWLLKKENDIYKGRIIIVMVLSIALHAMEILG